MKPIELKITVGEKEYIAPAPKTIHYKEYIKFLRLELKPEIFDSGGELDYKTSLIASVFQNENITKETLEDLHFDKYADLDKKFNAWISQYIPGYDDEKN